MKTSLSVFAGLGAALSVGAAAQAQDLAATSAGTWTVAVRATGVIPDASGEIRSSAGAATAWQPAACSQGCSVMRCAAVDLCVWWLFAVQRHVVEANGRG